MMLLEWLRRHDLAFARQVRLHVGGSGPIAREEEVEEAAGARPPPGQAGPARGKGEDAPARDPRGEAR